MDLDILKAAEKNTKSAASDAKRAKKASEEAGNEYGRIMQRWVGKMVFLTLNPEEFLSVLPANGSSSWISEHGHSTWFGQIQFCEVDTRDGFEVDGRTRLEIVRFDELTGTELRARVYIDQIIEGLTYDEGMPSRLFTKVLEDGSRSQVTLRHLGIRIL